MLLEYCSMYYYMSKKLYENLRFASFEASKKTSALRPQCIENFHPLLHHYENRHCICMKSFSFTPKFPTQIGCFTNIVFVMFSYYRYIIIIINAAPW